MKKILFLFFCALAVLVFAVGSAFAKAPGQRDQQQQKAPILPRPPVPQPNPAPKPAAPKLHSCTDKCAPRDAAMTHIVCILDRSGSMSSLTGDTIGGYNSFIDRQRSEPGDAVVTTVLFDNQYETLLKSVPIKDVKPITTKEYYARGTTALLDAVGTTVLSLLGEMDKQGRCPKSMPVIFMIMTDGLENASREFSRATVKKLVSDVTEKYGWQFIFLGANIDSAAEAGSIGISGAHSMNYSASADGVNEAYKRAGDAVRMYRKEGAVKEDWKK
jgi:hypothetical protein